MLFIFSSFPTYMPPLSRDEGGPRGPFCPRGGGSRTVSATEPVVKTGLFVLVSLLQVSRKAANTCLGTASAMPEHVPVRSAPWGVRPDGGRARGFYPLIAPTGFFEHLNN